MGIALLGGLFFAYCSKDRAAGIKFNKTERLKVERLHKNFMKSLWIFSEKLLTLLYFCCKIIMLFINYFS